MSGTQGLLQRQIPAEAADRIQELPPKHRVWLSTLAMLSSSDLGSILLGAADSVQLQSWTGFLNQFEPYGPSQSSGSQLLCNRPPDGPVPPAMERQFVAAIL